MHSDAELRLPWERAARGIALALIAVAVLRLAIAPDGAAAPAAHLAVTGDVTPRMRDSLGALARAGDAVTWSGAVAAVATAAEPVRDPSASTRISAVSDGTLALADSLGAIDSLPAGGGAIIASGLRGAVRVQDGATSAGTHDGAGAAPGRVLVLGRVGWEAKFTIAALEEAGWAVDARLRLADTLRVGQGAARVPLAGTHAAVVVLDSAIGADAALLARFVRAGGGLVLSGEAAAAPAIASIAPARAGASVEGATDAFDLGEPLRALALRPLTALRADAVALERRGGDVSVAARRVQAGRVVQSGYAESWRWRMQGGASGAREHREWWSRLVAAAAASTAVPAPREAGTEATADVLPAAADESAPRAALIQRLGPAVDAPTSAPSTAHPLPLWLGAITLVLLLAEWASRRARGAA